MIPKTHDPDESRWQKVLDRDEASDGKFVYAVRTTGVYCRPSCPSRRESAKTCSFSTAARMPRARRFPPLSALQARSFRYAGDAEQCPPCRNGRKRLPLALKQRRRSSSLEEIANVVKASPAHFHRFQGLHRPYAESPCRCAPGRQDARST
ncbi:Ada metal-binding domain-containing protein [Brucella abortus]|nr:Ada metal-binding domain-containing protein [Brucella abortus]